MLPGLVYNVCHIELASIVMLANVNKHQHFETCLHFVASKCFLTQVCRTSESNQLEPGQDDNSFSIGDLSIEH